MSTCHCHGGLGCCMIQPPTEFISNRPFAVDTPEARDLAGQEAAEAEAQAATQARSDHLMDLARGLDSDATREQAIDALEGVRRAHEPPPPEPWVKRL